MSVTKNLPFLWKCSDGCVSDNAQQDEFFVGVCVCAYGIVEDEKAVAAVNNRTFFLLFIHINTADARHPSSGDWCLLLSSFHHFFIALDVFFFSLASLCHC